MASAWSGVASAGVALALLVVALGQPAWEFHADTSADDYTWSYRAFEVHLIATNGTTQTTTDTAYGYLDTSLNQPGLANLFLDVGRWFAVGVLAAIAGAAMCAVTILKRVRGTYAGIAFLAACLVNLYVGLNLVIAIPPAASPLVAPWGQTIREFKGGFIVGGGTPSIDYGPGTTWYLLLIAGLVFAWGASEMWHVRPATRKVAAKEPAAPAASTEPAKPPEVRVVREAPTEPDLEEVFVIASSGLLVKHMSRSLMTDKDRDVVGGMISVVSNFVKEAFTERNGDVQEVSIGDHRFVLASEQGVVVAVLVRHGEAENVQHRLRHLLAVLLDRYGDRLVRWDGLPLDGIEDELQVLWEPFFVPPPPAD